MSPALRRCAWCKRPLSNVSDGRKVAKSKKSVERVYGGYLCHICLKDAILRWVVKEATQASS